MFKKLILNTKVFFHGLFHGLKGADEVISQSASYGSSDTEISQEQETHTAVQDMLRGEETQRVQELRYEYYKTLIESKNYHVDITGGFDDGDSTPLKAVARKKTALDFTLKIDVYNPEKLPIRVIQDNKLIPKHNNFVPEDFYKYGNDDYVSLFNFERDNFIPRFKLENYINKIVVRNNGEKVYLDLYTTMYASQFGKVDAIFIANLNELKKTGNKKSDITTLKEISFITDKAHGENDLCEFKFQNIEYKGIYAFDGNFVLTFEADMVSDGISVIEKYKTKEIDEKIKTKAVRDNAKKNGIDIFALKRDIDKKEENELSTQTFSLNKKEN